MVYKWDAAAERNLLLHVIAEMQSPETSIWPKVAENLGHGLNGNACRYQSHLAPSQPSLQITCLLVIVDLV